MYTKNGSSEFAETPTSPDYIHTGDSINLTCALYVASDTELDAVTWYIDDVEVEDPELFITDDYTNGTKTSTYLNANASIADGGAYKCKYTFAVGAPISFETQVSIHCKFSDSFLLLVW